MITKPELIAATHTPMDDRGELNLDRVADQAALLIEGQLDGAFIGGTTGESQSLTVNERKDLNTMWSEADTGDLTVFVHVGDNCQKDAIRLARHAVVSGADAVASIAPTYFKPNSPAELIEFFMPVADAADDLPFYFYDIPALTGVTLPIEEVARVAIDRIPNFAGIKFTSGDLLGMQKCIVMDGGRLKVLFGNDESLLAGLALGCSGGVGSTYNYAGRLYRQLADSMCAGDFEDARSCQFQSARMIDVIIAFGVLRTGKAIMNLLGVDCGPPRPPIEPLSGDEVGQVSQCLATIDVFTRPIHSITPI